MTTTRSAQGATHFSSLDGLRGVAAIAVMWLHEVGLFMPGMKGAWPGINGGLAVDLFFMLSGFVLAFAYSDKLDRGLAWGSFMLLRVVRLYPMLLIGILLGFLVVYLRSRSAGVPDPEVQWWTLGGTLLLMPMGFALRPFPPFEGVPFLFDQPIWSLLWEFIASAAFATGLRKLSRRAILGLLAVAGVALATFSVAAGTVGALGLSGWLGFAAGPLRVGVPFAIGALLWHSRLFERVPSLPFPVLALAVAAILFVPVWPNPVFDLLAVFVIFPLVVVFGARGTGFARACDWLGRVSYPLYILHYPVSRIVGFVAKRWIDEPIVLALAASVGSIAAAWIALVLYDEPVRRALGRRLRARTPA